MSIKLGSIVHTAEQSGELIGRVVELDKDSISIRWYWKNSMVPYVTWEYAYNPFFGKTNPNIKLEVITEVAARFKYPEMFR